ncbi:hypothetical protein ACWC91_41030 [Streptomyces sp. NPDC001204]
MNEPVFRQQIGYDLAGNPMYAPPVQYGPAPLEQQAARPLQPIKAHPWGAYIAGGCLGVLALTIVTVAIAFVVFGFAILAAVLALAVVALTVCLLVLRSMYRDYQKGR